MIEISRLTCLGSSLCCSDNDDDVAKHTTRLRVRPPLPVVNLAKLQNSCSLAKLYDSSNLVHDIDTKINAKDPDSGDNNKLSYSLL
jgi:hypothetical protein